MPLKQTAKSVGELMLMC